MPDIIITFNEELDQIMAKAKEWRAKAKKRYSPVCEMASKANCKACDDISCGQRRDD